MSRREALKLALMAGSATLIGAGGFASRRAFGESLYIEEYPISPLILNPFNDPLPIPKALAPTPYSEYNGWSTPPDPSYHDSTGKAGHQVWPSSLGLPDPIVYHVKLQVSGHSFTNSNVLAIDRDGRPTVSWDEQRNAYAAGVQRSLPQSCIYGFNGTVPGPRINAEYGKPVIVRFENYLDDDYGGWDRGDFGDPDLGFLTHLHNGHTAPESDGNPNYMHHMHHTGAYMPHQWSDNLYLNWPPENDDKEKQSFLWFHDHTHSHTGANVYKGMVGLYPIYDPAQNKDMGDETKGFRLPGVRTNNPDGSFDVEYDIPLALYDCRLDDGVTPHKDAHGGDGETHPEWWGKTFFRHFPNKGFVGDVFTVNGTAYPVLEVKRRKYRLRFLDASIARIYELKLMSSRGGPKSAASLGYKDDELQGQYRLPDGQQCMRFVQIATDGGLIPAPVVRNSFELWPAKRREFIVDFTKYMDGSPTRKGDVIYLTNVMKMTDGRMWDSNDPAYKVPLLKIVIGDDAPDYSLMPTALRSVPVFPYGEWKKLLANRRIFRLDRGGSSSDPEVEWTVNGEPFDPTKPMAKPRLGSYEVWEIQNGGGGWVHPMHIHQEEHRVVMRNGKPAPDSRHPDDIAKEDVIALDPGESVTICREFRTFVGPYVAHCHNLAHEDHSMMFGWEIIP
jgi:FtsP/CotA-like multicopper oxidase with cupredoxin domain